MINGHGDDVHQYSKITANFSSNVCQQLNLSGLAEHLCLNIRAIDSYPEPDAHSLVELISEKANVAANNISVTNGATEAIYLIAQAFRGSKTFILSPVFSEYADACLIHEHQITHIFSLDEIAEEVDLVWLCNPNNPTGEVYPPEALLKIIKQNPETCFVIDQSYAAFTAQDLFSIEEAIEFPNVILLHSLTKYFAIPGLRLGYLSAEANLVKRINHFRMPWSVNSLAIIAGKYLLARQGDLQIDLQKLLNQTKVLQQNLSCFRQLKVSHTNTHYFLVQLNQSNNGRTAAELKEYLATEHGMLIRDASNFVGLDKSYFRLASQGEEQDLALVAAIKTWLDNS